jgi:hypothetical protein
MDQPVSSLPERQNLPAMLRLLRASSAANGRSRRLDGFTLAVSLVIAALGPVSGFSGVASEAVALLGATWAGVSATSFAAWGRRERRRAALAQEMFDVELFDLPWNYVAAGELLSRPEVNRLGRRSRKPDSALRDYYDVPALEKPYDVLSCQQQNLAWGSRVRRRYSTSLLILVVGWCLVGLLVGWLAHLTVTDLALRWFIPSLGLLLLGTEAWRAQGEAAEERERVLSVLTTRLRHAPTGPDGESRAELLTLARQVQDVIFQLRQQHGRAPDPFFRLFRDRDREDFRLSVAEPPDWLAPRSS